jgi:hypothetical protein
MKIKSTVQTITLDRTIMCSSPHDTLLIRPEVKNYTRNECIQPMLSILPLLHQVFKKARGQLEAWDSSLETRVK